METMAATSTRVEEAIGRVLSSKEFSRSDQLKKILGYVCQTAAEGREADISESAIAEQVLNRRNFDPNADTIVRVQMRRLRQKLDEYYANDGADDLVRIEFQKHSYVPAFRADWRQQARRRAYLRVRGPFGSGFWLPLF